MIRITSLAAAAAILGYSGLALAQQPTYSPSYPNRYATQPTTGTTTVPAERQSWSPWRQTTTSRESTARDTMAPGRQTATSRETIGRETMARDTMAPTRQRTAMTAGQFSTEGDARAHCGGDTVVWVNTKSHVYHFAGSKDYGQTKRGAFMCRADADRAGTFHAAKNELKMQGRVDRTDRMGTDRSMTSRFSGSSTNRY
jgi:hypothetical protein